MQSDQLKKAQAGAWAPALNGLGPARRARPHRARAPAPADGARRLQAEGRVAAGYREGPLLFPPTYKLAPPLSSTLPPTAQTTVAPAYKLGPP